MTTNTLAMKEEKLNREDMIMKTDKMTMKEKKLKNLRRILWICFAGFSALPLLFALPMSIIFTMGEVIDTVGGRDIPVYPFFIMANILTVALIGGICLVIYYIFKYRIDRKDDNLFL